MYSHNYKFIFLHIGKCAGTSIKVTLKELDGLDSHCVHGHKSLRSMLRLIKKDGYDGSSYFKFACTRNPWDRHVSLFHHMATKSLRHPFPSSVEDYGGTFENFVMYYRNFTPPYEKMDFVIKYENLQQDFNHVCSELGLSSVELAYFKYKTNRPKMDYREYYDDRTRDKIKLIYAKEIELFGYTF